MRHLTKGRWIILLAGMVCALALLVGPRWLAAVRIGGQKRVAVSVCYMGPPLGLSRVGPDPYLRVRTDFERSFHTLRSLPADIFLASHARQFGRWRKLQERANAKNPADPFIDRAGYLSFITEWEQVDRDWLAEQERRP